MSNICPLIAAKNLADEEVGLWVRDLATFEKEAVPIAPAWVVPTSFLAEIAEQTHLFTELSKIYAVVNWQNSTSIQAAAIKIIHIIRQLKVPEIQLKGFSAAYKKWFDGLFLSVRPSFIRQTKKTQHLSELNVKGEANLLESLLHVLSHCYQAEFLQERYQEWQAGIKLPAALLLQQMIDAESSGVGMVLELHGQAHPVVMLYSIWGITENWPELQQHGDIFEVETKAWRIIRRQMNVKSKQWVRQIDKLSHVAVAEHLQHYPSLTDEGAIAIAKLIHQAQKRHFGTQLIDWAAERTQAFILDIRPVPDIFHAATSFSPFASPSHTHAQAAQPLTATKLFVSVADPQQSKTEIALADGIGLLRSEFTYTHLQTHPKQLMKTGKSEQIKASLARTVVSFHAQLPNVPIIFRSQNFTSNELASLKDGPDHEPKEANPYLGYRGAVRMIHDYSLFDIELDALRDAHEQGVNDLGMMLPFIRSTGELAILLHHFQKVEYGSHHFLKLWMQCNTPENILNLEQYCQKGLAGFSLNVQTISSLATGIDPDHPDLGHLYPLDVQLLTPLITHAQRITAKHHLPLHLHLENFHPELLRLAVELGLEAVVVKPRDLVQSRQAIVEAEAAKIVGKNF